MTKLSEFCSYVNEKIDIKDINCEQYIANDNMLKDKKGIKVAKIFPTVGKVIKFKVGDVLIGNIRPYFKKVWLASFDGGCSQDVLVFRSNGKVTSEYLYSILANDSFFDYIMLAPKGSKMPRGDKEHIMRYETDVPLNQKNIGNYICLISNSISNNEKMLRKYNDLLKFYYYKYFYTQNNKNIEMNSKLNREVPLSWKVYDFNHIPNTNIIKPGVDRFDVKNYLATANVVDETIIDGNYIDFDNRENRANMQPCKNSIWFAKMKDSIKRICLTDKTDWFVDKYILSTGFVGIECTPAILCYLYCYIAFDDFELIKNRLAHGDTQQAINGTDLDKIYIPVPSEEELNLFYNLVYPILELKNNLVLENQKLYNLREININQFT